MEDNNFKNNKGKRITPDTALRRAYNAYIDALRKTGRQVTTYFSSDNQMLITNIGDGNRIIYHYQFTQPNKVKESLFVTDPKEKEDPLLIIKRAESEPERQFDRIEAESELGEVKSGEMVPYYQEINRLYRIITSAAVLRIENTGGVLPYDLTSEEEKQPKSLEDVWNRIAKKPAPAKPRLAIVEAVPEKPLQETLGELLSGGYVEEKSTLQEELNQKLLPGKKEPQDPLDDLEINVEQPIEEKPAVYARDPDSLETVMEEKESVLVEEEMIPLVEKRKDAFIMYNLANEPRINEKYSYLTVQLAMASCLATNLGDLKKTENYNHFIVLGKSFVFDLGRKESLLSYLDVTEQPLSQEEKQGLIKLLHKAISKKKLPPEEREKLEKVETEMQSRKFLQMLEFLKANEGNIFVYESLSGTVKPEEIMKIFPEGNITVYSTAPEQMEDFVNHAFSLEKGALVCTEAYSIDLQGRKLYFLGKTPRDTLIERSLQQQVEELLLNAGVEAENAPLPKNEEHNIRSLVEYKKKKINES